MNPPIFSFTVDLPISLHVEGFDSTNHNVLGCEFKVVREFNKNGHLVTEEVAELVFNSVMPAVFTIKGLYKIIPTTGDVDALQVFNFYAKRTNDKICE